MVKQSKGVSCTDGGGQTGRKLRTVSVQSYCIQHAWYHGIEMAYKINSGQLVVQHL